MDKHRRKKLKKIVAMCMIFAAGVIFTQGMVFADNGEEIDTIIDYQTRNQTQELERQVDRFSKEGLSEILGNYDPGQLVKDIAKGRTETEMKSIWARAANLFLKEVYDNVNLLLRVMVIVMICAVLNNLRSSFLNESVGELAFFVSYIVLVTVLAAGFKEVSELGLQIVDDMVSFMYVTSPLLITLVASGGNIVTAGAINPVVILVVETAATIMKNVLIPVVMIATVVAIIDNVTEKPRITKIAELLRCVCTWGIGILLTIFTATVTVYGAVSAVTDGVAGKTVKYAIGSIPVVGGYLSDAADTVMGCALLVKNAAGVVAVLGVIGICILPILKIGALVLVYKAAGIIAEPVSDKRISKVFDEIAKSLVHIFAIVASVAFMFIITITAIIGASNIAAMVR